MSLLSAFVAAASDREHGAAEIELRLLRALVESRAGWQREVLVRGARLLLAGQPTMANLRSLAHRLAEVDDCRMEGFVRRRLELLGQLHERFAAHAWPLIAQAPKVVSLSRSSAVAAVLEGAHARGWRGRVVVFDGAATGGGVAQSKLLRAAGLDVISQPDAMMCAWLDDRRTEVLIGADAVSDRRAVNAIGSGVLLELARGREVSTVLVADTAKLVADAELDEIVAAGEVCEEPGCGRSWPLFELFQLRLVSWCVDEDGVRAP